LRFDLHLYKVLQRDAFGRLKKSILENGIETYEDYESFNKKKKELGIDLDF